MGAPAPRQPMGGGGTDWLPLGPPPEDGLPLLCFPHAGAGASVFRAWKGLTPPPLAVCPLQLPGRDGRFREPPGRAVGPLVNAAAEALAPLLDRPFAIFGHSMGAILAFEFTRALRRLGAPPPVHLFVSGRVAPQVRTPGEGLHRLPTPEFLRFIRSLGGIPERVLHGQAFAELMVPLLRADIEVNETYRHAAEPPLDVPLTVLAGRDDHKVPLRWVRPWAEHTTEKFALHVLPGGHFFPYDSPGSVLGLLADPFEEWS
ncbi:thioesterase II family protein [Streptomyces radicis]|uniref:Thioesterase n=1 Tax=Streptomyces radicis TaxID=1750517 RepID=A0A3A9X2W7_9ACTN|nr:alpha/beta fold hydrolase [Streptomyces radicis]RKN12857.1 thioesterase [Streptomyces radicis]RKN27378.1 thioesterase [Streptomyces radicis]